jgi:hypothetical protein
MLYLAMLSKFSSPRSAVTLETIVPPPPPVVLDLSLKAWRRLIASPRALHRLDPALRARHYRPLSQVIDLNPASLRVSSRRPLPQAIDLDTTPSTSDEGDTPPPSLITAIMWIFVGFERYLLPYVTVCVNVNEIWLCL